MELINKTENPIVMKFTIPVGGKPKKWYQFWKKDDSDRRAKESTIIELMSKYHENVQWDENTGTININGENQIPFKKDIWLGTVKD